MQNKDKFTYIKPRIKILTAILAIVLLSLTALGYGKIVSKNIEQSLTVLHTNDIHGHLEPFNYKNFDEKVGGAARLAGLINRIKSSNPNVLTLDAGDFAQGTLYFKIFNGKPGVEVLSASGYDAVEIGNHEFDKGLDTLETMISSPEAQSTGVQSTEVQFLCANLRFTKKPGLNNKIKPYIIKNYNGLRVGVIGVITPNLKALTNNLENVEILDPTAVVKKITEEIDPKTDLIIVLSHCGHDFDRDIAKSVKGIDVIIGGHSHTFMKKPDVVYNGHEHVIVVQDGEFGVNLGRLDLKIKDDEIKSFNYKPVLLTAKISKDKNVDLIVDNYSKKLQIYDKKIIGVVSNEIVATRRELYCSFTTGGSLLTNAIKSKFKDIDVVLQNSGTIRTNRVLPAGNISMADVMELYPFENKIIIAEINGKTLKNILNYSAKELPEGDGKFLQSNGLEYTVKLGYKRNTVTKIKVNGAPLDENKYYKVAVNDFMFNGGDGYKYFKYAKSSVNTGIYLDEAVMDYIKSNTPLWIKITDKIHLIKSSPIKSSSINNMR